jgi:hypothetical protein
MSFWQFWKVAITRAYYPSTGSASTLTTYITSGIAVVLLLAGVAGGAFVSWLLASVPFGLLLVLLIVGLTRSAHSLYLEEYNARQNAAETQTKLVQQVEQTNQRIAALQQQLSDPARQEKLAILRKFIDKGFSFLDWIMEHDESELHGRVVQELPKWYDAIKKFFGSEMPAGLSEQIDPFDFPELENRTTTRMFVQRRLVALGDAFNRLQNGG